MSDCACRSAALPSWFQPIYVLIHESCLDHLNIASLFCLSDDRLGVGRVICSWNKYSWCHFAPLQLVEPLGHFHGCSHYWRAPPSSTRIGSADSVFMFIRNCESSLRGVGLWSTLTSAAKVGEWQKDPAAAMTSYRPCQNRCMWYVISVRIHQINLEWTFTLETRTKPRTIDFSVWLNKNRQLLPCGDLVWWTHKKAIPPLV